MKRYLYEIDCGGCHDQLIPFMPRVLAEKTAKELNKMNDRRWKQRSGFKYTISKTHLTTGDGTPHGYKTWFDYFYREEK